MITSYSGRVVFPVLGPSIENGSLDVDEHRILSVGDRAAGAVRDLGQVAILPALVNAHTHLQYSQRLEPVGRPGMPFYEWIDTVVQEARDSPLSAEDHLRAYRQGQRELTLSGTAAVGEIATPGWPREVIADGPLATTVFLELLGLTRTEELLETAHEHIQEASLNWTPGLSPHAPYTVHPALLSEVCQMSAENQFPVAMHLAESAEELELLASGSGPFVEMLDRLGAWDATAIPRGIPIEFYLEQLATAHRALVVHGNFLSPREIDFLSRQPQMSVVYCPRTHAYFDHGNYPLEPLLAAGVRVALGTDSRASNPNLNLFEELQFIRQSYPELNSDDILRMGTLSGAEALGCEDRFGSLSPDKSPQAVVVSLPEGIDDAVDALLAPSSRVTHLIDGPRLIAVV